MNPSPATDEHGRHTRSEPGFSGKALLEALPFVILALLIPLFAVLQAARANELELITLFEDDAYYYFTIARNLGAGLGSTF